MPRLCVCSQSLAHDTKIWRKPAVAYAGAPVVSKPSPPPPEKCTIVPRAVPVAGTIATVASIGSFAICGQPLTVTFLQVAFGGAPAGHVASATPETVPRFAP